MAAADFPNSPTINVTTYTVGGITYLYKGSDKWEISGSTSPFLTSANIVETITNGVTTNAPSENAVFDALALKATIASPTFTGTPAAPTAAVNTNTTQLATTAFVQNVIVGGNNIGSNLFLYYNFY